MKKCISILVSMLLLFTCGFTVFAEEEEEIIELQIQMTVSVEDGAVIVDLVDDQQGTVSLWPVSLEVDGEQVDTVNTDEYGTATFHYSIPESTEQIACIAHDGGFDRYRFIGCTVYLDYAPVADEKTEATEDADAPTETEEESEDESKTPVTSTSVVVATTTTQENVQANVTPMTTTVKGNQVSIGVVPDNAFLVASGSTLTDYQSKARMWMDHDLYRSLVPPSYSSLQLCLALNSQAGDVTRLIAAKNANEKYASFADEEVKGFAMDLSIVYVNGNTTVPLDIEDSAYTIEIPVPATMKNAKKYAIAVSTSNGLSTLYEVKPSSGVLSFSIERFQTLAVVAFGSSSGSMNSIFDTPWLLVLVIIFGFLMVIGGILLLVFVVFRRKTSEKKSPSSSEETPSKRVSLDSDDQEDEVYVAPPSVTTQPTPKPENETPLSASEPVTPPRSSAPPVSTSVSKPKTTVVSTEEIDDLLDEVLSDLDN